MHLWRLGWALSPLLVTLHLLRGKATGATQIYWKIVRILLTVLAKRANANMKAQAAAQPTAQPPALPPRAADPSAHYY